MTVQVCRFKSDRSGENLSAFLRRNLGVSARKAKQAIEKGAVLLNGKTERFASTIIQKGDLVLFEEKVRGSLTLLFEDESVALYDKPAFLSSEDAAKLVPYILMHRLDKETSGVLLFAKNEQEAKHIEELFRKRLVQKSYLAVCEGSLPSSCCKKSFLSVAKRSKGKLLMKSTKEGAFAHTEFEPLSTKRGKTLVQVTPKTGRTHQIRVHLRELGYPILGDALYGTVGRRLFLHAHKLLFVTTAGKEIAVSAPIPEEFACVFSS